MLLKEVKTTRRRRRPLLDDPSSATAPTTAPTTTAAAGHEGLLPAAEDPFRPPLPGLDDDDDDGNGTPEQSAPPHPPPPLARPPYASAALAALADEYADCVGRGAWGQARACLERLPTGGDERPRALVEMAGALLGSLPARGWRLSVVEAGQQEGQGQGQMRQRRLRIAAHGGASTAPEKLEAEVLGPLCAAVLAAAWADEEEGMHEEAQQQHQQQQEPGAPLLLALRLEAATRREGAGAWATYAAARLVASRPGLASLHCCGLALGLAGSRSTTGGGGGATAPAPEGLDCMLGILALSLPGAIEVEATMRDLTSCAASSSLLPPWEVEEEEDGAYRVLPPALATRPSFVAPLLPADAAVAEGEAAAAAELAEALWADVQAQYHDPTHQQQPDNDQAAASASLSLRTRQLQRLRHGGPGQGRSSPPAPLPIALLERLRARWAAGRKAPRGAATSDARLLARALLGLLRRYYAPAGTASGECTEAEAEAAVGDVLPLVFVLVEEYGKEELQLLGFLAWAHALAAAGAASGAGPAFGRQLSGHLGIQMTVLSRCLRVAARKPRILRPLLYCAVALLRVARLHPPPSSAASSAGSSPRGRDQDQRRREELDRWRRSLLESLLHAIPRSAYFIPHGVTDPRQIAEERALGFVLLEGVSRLVREIEEGGGCGLVRYLRPLTHVLAMQPLEEGGAADRILALRTLLLVLGQCRPMAHQLAHETLAQVLRVYLGLIARQQQQEEQERQQGTVTKHNATVLRLCRRVGAALAGACVERAARRGGGGGGDPNDPLRAWVASIEAKGVPELKGFWDVDDGGDDGATGPV